MRQIRGVGRQGEGSKPRMQAVHRAVAIAVLSISGTPLTAQTLVGDGSLGCGTQYVVASGDTLSVLANRAYGDPTLYNVLIEANADQIRGDPNSLAVGMSILVPCVDASGAMISEGDAAEMAASLDEAIAVEGPLTDAELDALFGPVALFPDMVLTNVLVASTLPIEVVQAARFIENSEASSDEARAESAAEQNWDESIKELAAGFPDLLTRMNDHIDWTVQAGDAVVTQTDEVLASVQRLRKSAQENGYLVDNEAQNIEVTGNAISIQPATPGVVYVPTYATDVVYTTPISHPPQYHYGYDYDDDDWEDALIAGSIFLGGAVILDEIFDDDDWDNRWDDDVNIDWDGGDINIDRGDREYNFGDGDRERGDRSGAAAGLQDRSDGTGGQRPGAGIGNRAVVGDRPAAGSGVQLRDDNREAARNKIEARKPASQSVAKLPAARPSEARQTARNPSISRPTANTRSAAITRPSKARTPTARRPSSSNAFRSDGGRSRASGRDGGRARGGGGRRR
jgi:hypothetical protein